ncbi:hypothetical protein FQR65_LT14419 [Abscondita terminalis]|nr:hypothetical protein FQR65_LT14419 [Abscondita terminalis]
MSYNTRKSTSKLQQTSKELFSDSDDQDFSASDSEYQVTDSSSSECDTESENNTENSSENSDGSDGKRILLSQKKLLRKISDKAESKKNYIIQSDNYFSNYEAPKLQQEELEKLLSSHDVMVKHKKNLKQLSVKNSEQFSKWLYLMKEGFNVLLYGLGSKMTILQNFIQECISSMPVIVINGFFPNLSIKNVVDNIINDVLELSDSTGSIYDACDLIVHEMSCLNNMSLYMVINNIEGDMLRNSKAQSVLSKLASVPNIHVIASIDHVNAPLIWDNTKLSNFNFIWFDVTSFLPYLKETCYEGSSVIQRSKTLVLSSLNNVFLSLTSNSKGIYLIIVKYQLEHGKVQHYQGLSFKDLYWSCREAFLVSSDLALRSQLTEFVDHKMLKMKRSIDGTESIFIPTANNILQQFFDEQSKK